MGKVNCDQETSIAKRFQITKYPTLKVIQNGEPVKREYRGQRSKEAFVQFVRDQLRDPIQEFGHLKELEKLDTRKRIIVGYFDRRDMPEYNMFRRVAGNLKDDCHFHVGFGDVVAQMHPPGWSDKALYSQWIELLNIWIYLSILCRCANHCFSARYRFVTRK